MKPPLCSIYLPVTSSLLGPNILLSMLGYGLDDRGFRVRFPVGAGNLSLHHRVQNGSRTRPASYPVVTRVSFPGIKAAGA